ncbi:MAG: hypothetical protein FVQ77_11760 [Cytophagales bacterium]|nr:hypothetical protein [Cytophagales bacterium]
MSTTKIREELHQTIDQGDERLVKMIYAMVREYNNEEFELSDEHKKILDERLASHKADPRSGSSWGEVKARIEKQL